MEQLFQSTLPRGERLLLSLDVPCRHDFNPRSREGSDSVPSISLPGPDEFQSTLPRGERQIGQVLEGVEVDISIHAPARGATAAAAVW